MGQVILLKCKHCGNEWEHYDGVGFESKPLQGNKKENRTGDADDRICCPKCGSEDFERDDQKIVAFWD